MMLTYECKCLGEALSVCSWSGRSGSCKYGVILSARTLFSNCGVTSVNARNPHRSKVRNWHNTEYTFVILFHRISARRYQTAKLPRFKCTILRFCNQLLLSSYHHWTARTGVMLLVPHSRTDSPHNHPGYTLFLEDPS
jgi:hypothetical protein